MPTPRKKHPTRREKKRTERKNIKPTDVNTKIVRLLLLTRYDGHFSADRDIRMYLVGGLKKTQDKKIDGKI